MSWNNVKQLLAATKDGILEDVRAAFEACSVDEQKGYGYEALLHAAENSGPGAFDIVEFLIERGANPHEKDSRGDTAFTVALNRENFDVANYLFYRGDFLPGDLIPRPKEFPLDTYKTYSEMAILRVNLLIDKKGASYARAVIADIEKILKAEKSKPTQEDVRILRPLITKIVSKDWVGDAQVSSDDFLGCEMER